MSGRSANTRWVGKISSPGSEVATSTTSMRLLPGRPSSDANATAVSYRWWPSAISSCLAAKNSERPSPVDPPQAGALGQEVGLDATGRRRVARRRRAGRSARAAPVPHEGAEACSPSGRRASAREAARSLSRRARRPGTQPAPCGCDRRHPGRRSPARPPRQPAHPSSTSVPSSRHAWKSRPASSSESLSVRWTTL